MTQPSIATLERKLGELCQQIYELGGVRFQPLKPWILVRVLDKAQKVGSILLTDKQGRTLYEGFVLRTYPGCTEIQVGERILFPHFEGMPVPDLDDKYYRIVRHYVNQKDYPQCGVWGKIDYQGDVKLRTRIKELFNGVEMVTYQDTKR